MAAEVGRIFWYTVYFNELTAYEWPQQLDTSRKSAHTFRWQISRLSQNTRRNNENWQFVCQIFPKNLGYLDLALWKVSFTTLSRISIHYPHDCRSIIWTNAAIGSWLKNTDCVFVCDAWMHQKPIVAYRYIWKISNTCPTSSNHPSSTPKTCGVRSKKPRGGRLSFGEHLWILYIVIEKLSPMVMRSIKTEPHVVKTY